MYVGFEVFDGCGMRTSCKDFEVLGGVCNMYLGGSVWRRFVGMKFGKCVGGVVVQYSLVCVGFLQCKGGVCVIVVRL